MTRYEIWLTDDFGTRIRLLDDLLGFSATRTVGAIASFSASVPVTFDRNLLKPDRMVQVWRGVGGAKLGLWRTYFLRKWIPSTSRDGTRNLIIFGRDPLDLLRRRIIAYYTDEAQASKTDFADDMMKEVVTEAIADGAAPAPASGTRVWANLSIEANVSAGPTITKAFSWDKLLTTSGGGVMPSLAKASHEAGTEIFYDIVPSSVTSSSIAFQFITRTGQPGRDVTDTGLVFSIESGSLQSAQLTIDYSEEENYIYAGGKGATNSRDVQQLYAPLRYSLSQWNRCEGFADARNQGAANGVREAGRAKLIRGRPVRSFSGIPVDTFLARFGVHWNFGDKVRAKFEGEYFDCIVKSVTLSVDEMTGTEKISARLEYED